MKKLLTALCIIMVLQMAGLILVFLNNIEIVQVTLSPQFLAYTYQSWLLVAVFTIITTGIELFRSKRLTLITGVGATLSGLFLVLMIFNPFGVMHILLE